MASRLGPARPRGSTANGAGAWLIFSQSRQVNFSRTICTTFHCRGTTSSRSVTSSPSLASLMEPQQLQVVGPGTITRSRGRCAGNSLRAGFLRKARTCVVSLLAVAAFSAASSSSVAAASSSSSWSSIWSTRRALRSLCAPNRSRLSFSIVSRRCTTSASALDASARALAASARACTSSASRARRHRGENHSCSSPKMESQYARLVSRQSRNDSQCRNQPAACGRHVCCGRRQSMPSSKYPSCAGVIVTVRSAPSRATVDGQTKRPRSSRFANRHMP